jgi:hypothetical protein
MTYDHWKTTDRTEEDYCRCGLWRGDCVADADGQCPKRCAPIGGLFANKKRRPRIYEIQQLVAARFEVSVDELISPVRGTRLTIARWISMKLCATYVWMSCAGIARAHHRDHSTMFTGMRKLEAMLDAGRSPFCGHLAAIEAQLRDQGFRLHAVARVNNLPVSEKLDVSKFASY